jgi:glycosyltransferase involved in cell wall biosynthesis
VPSLFEPFGIVALEAMAAKSPVVVSDTGGLSEIVEHDSTGVKVYPNNPDSLAWGITKVLLDENYRNRIRENAYKKVQEKYDWDKIAQQTKWIYEAVLGAYSKSFWA